MNPCDCDDDGAAGILMPSPSFHRRGQYQYFPKFQNTSSFFVPPWFDEWSEALLAFPFMRLLVITIVTVLEDNGVVIKKNPLAFWFCKTLFSLSVDTNRLLQRLIKMGYGILLYHQVGHYMKILSCPALVSFDIHGISITCTEGAQDL